MVEPLCLNFRVFTIKLVGVPQFSKFTVISFTFETRQLYFVIFTIFNSLFMNTQL